MYGKLAKCLYVSVLNFSLGVQAPDGLDAIFLPSSYARIFSSSRSIAMQISAPLVQYKFVGFNKDSVLGHAAEITDTDPSFLPKK